MKGLIDDFGIQSATIPKCRTANALDSDACSQQFATVDEFFTREMYDQAEFDKLSNQMELEWIHLRGDRDATGAATRAKTILDSPAESYVVTYPTTTEAQKFWVKGKKYTIDAPDRQRPPPSL